jgi:hypothetical protein
MRLLAPVRVVLAAVVTCLATPAYAQWARHHGSECVKRVGSLDRIAVTMGGLTNPDPSWGADIACASDDADAFPDSAVSELRVYVYDASETDSISVQVCATLRGDQSGGVCSGARKTTDSFVGPGVLTFSGSELDAWREGYNFGYLYIWLPAKSGPSGFSYIKGWITQH